MKRSPNASPHRGAVRAIRTPNVQKAKAPSNKAARIPKPKATNHHAAATNAASASAQE